MSTFTNEMFIERLRNTNPNIQPLGEYISAKSKIRMRCLTDGYEWITTPDNINGGCGCPKCGIASSAKSKRSSMEKFIEKLEKINPNIEVAGKYINARTHVHCICKIDGYQWDSSPDNLLRGYGCRKCGAESRMQTVRTNGGKTYRRTHVEFIELLSTINKNVEIVDEYIDSGKQVTCRCLIHGETWKTRPPKLLEGKHACPICMASEGEKVVAGYLRRNNIKYVMQYRFKACKNKFPLPFDFYIPDKNVCIEYDGKQHDGKTWFYGKDPEGMIKRDQIKNNFCKDNRIKLIRIPCEVKDIETFLAERL